MYRIRRYPTVYAALSFLALGMATYVSGFDGEMGIKFSFSAVAYILVYLTFVKLFKIDDPDNLESN
jgi:hypothetical protein